MKSKRPAEIRQSADPRTSGSSEPIVFSVFFIRVQITFLARRLLMLAPRGAWGFNNGGGVQLAFPLAAGSGRPNWVRIVMDCTGHACRPQCRPFVSAARRAFRCSDSR